MKVYIAGPMQGYDQFNFPAFDKAAEYLRSLGHEVFNPADKDRENYGQDFQQKFSKGSIAEAETGGFSLRRALSIDCQWICDNAEAIFMLKGWERSGGARAEHALASALRLHIMYE